MDAKSLDWILPSATFSNFSNLARSCLFVSSRVLIWVSNSFFSLRLIRVGFTGFPNFQTNPALAENVSSKFPLYSWPGKFTDAA